MGGLTKFIFSRGVIYKFMYFWQNRQSIKKIILTAKPAPIVETEYIASLHIASVQLKDWGVVG